MKKRYIYILLVSILFIVSLIVIGNDTKTFKINGIKYYWDEEKSNIFYILTGIKCLIWIVL